MNWMRISLLALLFGFGTLLEVPQTGYAQDTKSAPKQVASAGVKKPLDGAKLFMEKTCFSCHGKDAKTPILPNFPKLAGQNPAYMLQQIKDIKSGARSNGSTAAMKGVLFLVNEEEMKAITDYLATLTPFYGK